MLDASEPFETLGTIFSRRSSSREREREKSGLPAGIVLFPGMCQQTRKGFQEVIKFAGKFCLPTLRAP